MSPKAQERVFPKEYAVELIRIADGDLASAETLRAAKDGGRPENVLYLAQQAAEKFLKAALCRLERPIPLVHDLGILAARLPTDPAPPFGYEIIALNPFATVRRYEESSVPLDADEINSALDKVRVIQKWVKGL